MMTLMGRESRGEKVSGKKYLTPWDHPYFREVGAQK